MDLKFFKTIAYCYRAVSQNYWVNRALETYDAVFLALTDLRMPKDPNKPDIVSNSNIVSGNIIGLNAAGSAKLANSYGVFINTGSNNTHRRNDSRHSQYHRSQRIRWRSRHRWQHRWQSRSTWAR